MPNNVLYYQSMIDFCNVAGEWVNKTALLDDIRNGDPTSPDSIKTLAKYYDGDVNVLANKRKAIASKANNSWFMIRDLLKAEKCWSQEDDDAFVALIKKPTEYCDFRAKVRDWARNELERERKGKESVFYDLRSLIDRYQKLILKRNQKR